MWTRNKCGRRFCVCSGSSLRECAAQVVALPKCRDVRGRRRKKGQRREEKVRLGSVSVVQVEGFDEMKRAHGGGAEHPD